MVEQNYITFVVLLNQVASSLLVSEQTHLTKMLIKIRKIALINVVLINNNKIYAEVTL